RAGGRAPAGRTTVVLPDPADPLLRFLPMSTDGSRRSEILETAATIFASAGFRASLQEIADACGILPGSLYHHFGSKEAIVIELVRRYRDDLDRVADEALRDLRQPSPKPVEDRDIELGR